MATRSPLSRPSDLRRIGKPPHLGVEVGIGQGPGVTGFAHPVVGDLVAMLIEMPIEAVVGEVELAVGEPLVEGSIGVIETYRGLLEPGDTAQGLLGPIGDRVGSCLFVDSRFGVGLGRELRRRGEAAILAEQVLDGLGHSDPSDANSVRPSYAGPKCRAPGDTDRDTLSPDRDGPDLAHSNPWPCPTTRPKPPTA